jgi:hypothetical protein
MHSNPQLISVAPVLAADPVESITSIVPGSENNNNHHIASHQPEALMQPNVQRPIHFNAQVSRNTSSRYALSALGVGILTYLVIRLCSSEKNRYI